MLIKLLAFELLWFGSLAVYLSSSHQVLIKHPVNKKLGALTFVFLSALSLLLLQQQLLFLSASLLALVLVMLAWISLALFAPYSRKLFPVIMTGAIFSAFTAFLGA